MGVSVSKHTSTETYFDVGSDEYSDICSDIFCDPCLTRSQKVKAQGFCKDCKENLCRGCFDYHPRSRASRNHQLQRQTQAIIPCNPCLMIDQQIIAIGYCEDCRENLCKNCYDYHPRTNASKNHKLLKSPKTLASIKQPGTSLNNANGNNRGNKRTSNYNKQTHNCSTHIFKALHYKFNMNISTNNKSDSASNIYGCAVLTSDRIVLADYKFHTIKILDTHKQFVVNQLQLKSAPHDVVAIGQDEIAIAISYPEELLIIKVSPEMSISRNIKINRQCFGLIFYQDKLYLLCQNPNSVLIMDLTGNIQREISLPPQTFSKPFGIALSKDLQHLFISDIEKKCVVKITLQGEEVSACSTFGDQMPHRLLVLPDGSLLVCCLFGKNLHHIADDLVSVTELNDGKYGRSLCYMPDKHLLFLGIASEDFMKVFRVEYIDKKSM